MKKVAIFGECMLELSHGADGTVKLGYGGDTLNTAVYLSRLGVDPRYITALGSDHYSDWLLSAWREEGVDTRFVQRHPDKLPGLYAIKTDPSNGERSFSYWRDTSAARSLFQLLDHSECMEAVTGVDVLYVSGITLSIFSEREVERLCAVATAVRKAGGQVAFDPNFRPQGWPSREKGPRDNYEILPNRISCIANNRR